MPINWNQLLTNAANAYSAYQGGRTERQDYLNQQARQQRIDEMNQQAMQAELAANLAAAKRAQVEFETHQAEQKRHMAGLEAVRAMLSPQTETLAENVNVPGLRLGVQTKAPTTTVPISRTVMRQPDWSTILSNPANFLPFAEAGVQPPTPGQIFGYGPQGQRGEAIKAGVEPSADVLAQVRSKEMLAAPEMAKNILELSYMNRGYLPPNLTSPAQQQANLEATRSLAGQRTAETIAIPQRLAIQQENLAIQRQNVGLTGQRLQLEWLRFNQDARVKVPFAQYMAATDRAMKQVGNFKEPIYLDRGVSGPWVKDRPGPFGGTADKPVPVSLTAVRAAFQADPTNTELQNITESLEAQNAALQIEYRQRVQQETQRIVGEAGGAQPVSGKYVVPSAAAKRRIQANLKAGKTTPEEIKANISNYRDFGVE